MGAVNALWAVASQEKHTAYALTMLVVPLRTKGNRPGRRKYLLRVVRRGKKDEAVFCTLSWLFKWPFKPKSVSDR